MAQVERLQFRAMGTDVEIVIADSNLPADDVRRDLQEAKTEIDRLELLMSRFIPTSDISRLNDNPGKFVGIANETAQVLLLAEQACRETKGLFSPCLGAWMERYGYDRSFDLRLDTGLDGGVQADADAAVAGTQPRDDAGSPIVHSGSDVNPLADLAARLGRGYVPYTVGTGGRFRLEPGYKLDLGGIAKGWIVEQAADVLHRRGYHNFVCSAGGDMVCAGREGDKPWSVGIADPFVPTAASDPCVSSELTDASVLSDQPNPSAAILTLSVESSAVATSGTYRRRWNQGGTVRHHILDPRTGQPAESDLVSVTVVHERLTAAEVAAKVVLLLGREQGLCWLRDLPHRGWVAITADGELLHAWQ